MMKVREITIKFSANKKRERLAQEQLLNHDIEVLEHQLQQSPVTLANVQAELDTKKAAIEELYNYQTQGAYIRTLQLL